jgi:hypothetical protein
MLAIPNAPVKSQMVGAFGEYFNENNAALTPQLPALMPLIAPSV